MTKKLKISEPTVKGIRRISPTRRQTKKDDKQIPKGAKDHLNEVKEVRKVEMIKKGKSVTSKSVLEFQFYSLLEVHGVSRELLKNKK